MNDHLLTIEEETIFLVCKSAVAFSERMSVLGWGTYCTHSNYSIASKNVQWEITMITNLRKLINASLEYFSKLLIVLALISSV